MSTIPDPLDRQFAEQVRQQHERQTQRQPGTSRYATFLLLLVGSFLISIACMIAAILTELS